MEISGSIRLFFLFDVGEEIDFTRAAELRGGDPARRKTSAHAPRYLGFESPPLLLAVETAGETEIRAKAFSYGVLSVEYRLPSAADWDALTRQTATLLDDGALAEDARARAAALANRLGNAIRDRYPEWLSEEYLAVEIHGTPIEGSRLLELYRSPITQLVRGEVAPLSATEQQEVLGGAISCYPSDMLVAGWAAAVVYDATEGREDTLQLLEYANAQLLEYRHYAERLNVILRELHALTRQHMPFWKRAWRRYRAVKEAERLNNMRLEIRDLSDRNDDSLRLLGDMFYNRAYRLISSRIGLDDYRRLVEEKLHTAGELYQFLALIRLLQQEYGFPVTNGMSGRPDRKVLKPSRGVPDVAEQWSLL